MSLITFFLALFVWILLSTLVARFSLGWVKKPYRIPAISLMAMIIFILPAVDEIIGKYQFKSLCAKNSIIDVTENIEGRTVFLMAPPTVEIQGYVLPIRMQYWKFADKKTNEVVFSYKIFYSKGGFLGRVLQLSSNGDPVLFYGICMPPKSQEFREMISEFHVNLVD